MDQGLRLLMHGREEFLAHYHKRSNVATTFSMIKRKVGDSLRSKTDTAQVAETMAKVLCHNIVVLIHEAYELGIAPVFGRMKLMPKKPGPEGHSWAKPAGPRGNVSHLGH